MTDDDVLGLQMIHEGVQDYLPKTVLAQNTSTTALTHAIRYAIERKRTEEQMAALNERLQIANEELAALNQELRLDVKERSTELQVSNEELRVSNEELRQEVEQRTAAERDVESRVNRLAILNTIIHVLNEAPDLSTLYERTLITTTEQLGFERGLIATANGNDSSTCNTRTTIHPSSSTNLSTSTSTLILTHERSIGRGNLSSWMKHSPIR